MNTAIASAPDRPRSWKARIVGAPSAGPLLVLIAFCVIFAFTNPRFLATQNLSIILQQTVIIGVLAIGQTLVILTAGIDLAVGAICVLGTIVAGKLVNLGYDPVLSMGFAVLLCTISGLAAGRAGQWAEASALHRNAWYSRHPDSRPSPDIGRRCLCRARSVFVLDGQYDEAERFCDHLWCGDHVRALCDRLVFSQ